jgi:hypothetical protein
MRDLPEPQAHAGKPTLCPRCAELRCFTLRQSR